MWGWWEVVKGSVRCPQNPTYLYLKRCDGVTVRSHQMTCEKAVLGIIKRKIKYADRYKASIFSGKKCRHLQIAAMRTGAVAAGKNFECK